MAKKEELIKLGIIGIGKMGEALIQGLSRREELENRRTFFVSGTTHTEESAQDVRSRLSIECHKDNRELAKECRVLVLCVKPHQAEAVLKQIAPVLKNDHILISICAAITTEQLAKWTKKKPKIVRAMPNTPALIGEGVTALCGKKGEALDLAIEIFESVGSCVVVEEHLMDGVTGLSGCGPAYVYLIVEALSEAGVKVGLPRSVSTLLAAKTLMGAAKMVLERGEHPAALKDEVTTPAGCTIDGLMALEEGKLRVTLIKAVLASTKRSQRLRSE